MKQIKLSDGKDYLFMFSHRVTTQIRAEIDFDPFKEDWLDNPSIIEGIGYYGAVEGSTFKGEKFPYSKDQFGALLDGPAAIEVVKEYVDTLRRWAEYMIANTEKKQTEREP